MKKKLEAELISIAHKVLQLKHKEDVRELHREAQRLYEKLSVLLFVEENFSDVQPTIGKKQIEEKLEHAFDYNEKIIIAQLEEELDESILPIENTEAENKEITPIVETILAVENFEEEITEKENTSQIIENKEDNSKSENISMDAFFNQIHSKTVSEKINTETEEKTKEEKITPNEIHTSAVKEIFPEFMSNFNEITFERVIEKPVSNLNDKISRSVGLSLNDRMAFEKNLFDGSTEDLNRVLSQLETFKSYQEAKDFIEEMVKPDYNNWLGREDYEERFMEYIISKFA
ncbi:hypothetical protein BWK63_09415 [Flavobacterium covae]|uniref:Uncharacterized protein n=1 Tax=Flavobacterium covae TaxID=2906076 RepID=A0ABW8PHS4_9FLAO|nr:MULTISPECIES: hypothetical protein [Flavobacterium]MCJ1806998.1 hypothetical protein [Flavobacterium covae]OWP80731.1 hypothetical protein BWK63_09415 [Flavobacterium covae]POR22170.1 hypothetical protein BWK57_07175 [Flavobacterium columnare]